MKKQYWPLIEWWKQMQHVLWMHVVYVAIMDFFSRSIPYIPWL